MTSTQKVTFPSEGVSLTGRLFLPGGDAPAPGIVVAGTWTSVKELMADRYAERLADRGCAALSFDFTGFGESGGEPRDVESPELKIRDIRNAVTFLAGHPAVDGARLGALGGRRQPEPPRTRRRPPLRRGTPPFLRGSTRSRTPAPRSVHAVGAGTGERDRAGALCGAARVHPVAPRGVTGCGRGRAGRRRCR
ncbi:hypothetical protein GCM10010182_01540 [Actinomadura cremea]|nr:hypothetical protein GCM10010182_01540 [Actinomadura cremea]